MFDQTFRNIITTANANNMGTNVATKLSDATYQMLDSLDNNNHAPPAEIP